MASSVDDVEANANGGHVTSRHDKAHQQEAANDVQNDKNNSKNEGSSDSGSCDYYYFGYGPMVHPTTRERRGINVVDEKPAVLPNYRLTFAYGGLASAVQQRGFDVHGVVMKCATVEDWEKLKSFEVGTFYPTIEEVHLYDNDDDEDIDDQEEDPVMPLNDDYNDNTNTRIIRAHVFHMVDFDESKLEEPIEKLPQERYLKLIASGMQRYKVSSDYIGDHIMATPFIPQRKPDDYLVFPAWTEQRPKLSLERYQRIAQESKEDHMLYFIIGTKVLLVHAHPEHPVSIWLQHYAVGQLDLTFTVQQFVVDPDIPYCPTRDSITPQVVAWTENHMHEIIIETSGIVAAYHVMDLTGSSPSVVLDGSTGSNNSHQQEETEVDERDLQAFVEQLQEEVIASTSATTESSVAISTTAVTEEVAEDTFVQGNKKAEELTISSSSQQQQQSSSRRGKSRIRKSTSVFNGVFKGFKLRGGNRHNKDDTNTTRRQRRKTWAAPAIHFSS